MKKIVISGLIGAMGLMSGCAYLTNQGVVIGPPTVKTTCVNPASSAEVADIKSRISKEAFKDDKLSRARFVTKDKCFKVNQIVDIIGVFAFEDNKLALAKDLYDQCVDQNNYDLVVDALVHKSNKDELRNFINSQ